MKVTVKTEPNCKRIFEIEIPVEDVEAEYKNQLHQYRLKAKIPGFRPGKAPIDMVKGRFHDNIKADVLEALVPMAFDEAIQKEELLPLGFPELSDIKYEEGQPLSFKARVEVQPEINLHKYTGHKFERRVKDVTEADVNKVLKQLQYRYAEFTPVERKCHDDDLVIVDLIKKYDKLDKLKEDKLESVPIDLSSEQVLKEFKENLRGMGIGEMKEIEVKYPDDYFDNRLAGNEIRYLTIIKEVKEKELPPLDDEFAKSHAQLESIEELKKTLKENLVLKANDDADDVLKGEIIKKIVENNRFEVPESIIEKYLQSVTEDFKKQYDDVDEFQLRQSYRQVGEDIIRWQYIYHRIADKDNIKVNEEDRAEWVKKFARVYNMSEKTARETLGKTGKFEEIDDTLLEKKVLDFIKENSKITT